MPLILSIDTALESAAVCIAEGEGVLASRMNSRQQDHASWIHSAIRDMLAELRMNMKTLAAVAVTAGPGSYTGLRVGMATAKGICYAMNIPLITETTLKLIAKAVKKDADEGSFLSPMIDARRMEVFTALYDYSLQEIEAPSALILDEFSFREVLERSRIVFGGSGSYKWKPLCHHPNAHFSSGQYSVDDLALSAASKFLQGAFTELAYSEPLYIKSFYTGKES